MMYALMQMRKKLELEPNVFGITEIPLPDGACGIILVFDNIQKAIDAATVDGAEIIPIQEKKTHEDANQDQDQVQRHGVVDLPTEAHGP
jgi:hypothetical protein